MTRTVDEWAGLSVAHRTWITRRLTLGQQRELSERWSLRAHAGQREPPGQWRVWLIQAGRGFGKTRAGAEWVSQIARDMPGARIALVGATLEEVRGVMIEGQSGLLSVARQGERPRWRSAARELHFASGAVAVAFSAASPEKLRGPEHHVAWCDELAKWRHGDAAWDNLMLGLRLGEQPRVLVTTTPKPVPLMRKLIAMKGVERTGGATTDNPHLPAAFASHMDELYGGTRLGRQELLGEMVEDLDHPLWRRAALEAVRVEAEPAAVRRVVVGVDPPAGGEGGGGDACGIVAVALGGDGLAYVLEDASVPATSPERWADAVAACAARHGADRVVAEANQGGEMVRAVLLAADGGLPVRLVRASRGKAVRAEPVATLYERDKVRHVGRFPALEDELCGLEVGGAYRGPGRSPDRADALVWALTALMLDGRRGTAGVRVV